MKLLPYLTYKKTTMEWLPEAPEHWDLVLLGQICTGISTGPFGTALGSEDYIAGGIPVINPSHIINGKCIPDEEITVSNITSKRLNAWQMSPGDVVVARRGEIGRSALIREAEAGWICGTGSLRITPNAMRSHAPYIHAVLQSSYAKEWLNLASVGSTMPNISEAIIGRLPIALPSTLAEQSAIAAFLDRETSKIDALVAEQERLIALLKEKRQAVISQAVTKGRDPTVPMKESGVAWLGEVPAHWEVLPMKRFLHEPLTYGANQASDDDTPGNPRFVRITDVADDGSLREDTFRSLPPAVAEQYLLSDGDILLARSGATVGKSFRYKDSWGICCFAGYLIRARFDTKRLTAEFAEYLCSSKLYWAYIQSEQIQATIPNVSAERYGAMHFPCPPTYEQIDICSYLNGEIIKIGTLTAEAERAITLLRERRAALISAAVTGKIDVRDHAAAGQATAA